MIQNGLVNEVRHLRELGCEKGMTSMQALGYKEILDYLSGECTLEEAVAQIKLSTRHFAKRQLTWFRREEDVIWLNKQDYDYDEDKILGKMLSDLRREGVIK